MVVNDELTVLVTHDSYKWKRCSSRRPRWLCLTAYFLLLFLLAIFGYNQQFWVHVYAPIWQGNSVPSDEDVTIRIARNESSTVQIPPLNTLISTKSGIIIGDISWMLDFAIIAFPKSGTTFMKDYLNHSNETYLYDRELCMKHSSDVPGFVKKYHAGHVKLKQSYPLDRTDAIENQNLNEAKRIKFGLKCPGVLYRKNDLDIYRQYFPRTKLIIGIRHPVSWFESFYNYQSYRNVSLPPTSQLIGKCGPQTDPKVCTDRARFHAALARLGKTSMDTEDEISLLFGLRHAINRKMEQHNYRRKEHGANYRKLAKKKGKSRHDLQNDIFLYEVRQITDESSNELSTNLKHYLDTEEDFPEILPFSQNKTRTINICDKMHDDVRGLLVEHGTDAADWIRDYFVKNPSVTVSSPTTFFRFLDDWRVDPCSNNVANITQ